MFPSNAVSMFALYDVPACCMEVVKWWCIKRAQMRILAAPSLAAPSCALVSQPASRDTSSKRTAQEAPGEAQPRRMTVSPISLACVHDLMSQCRPFCMVRLPYDDPMLGGFGFWLFASGAGCLVIWVGADPANIRSSTRLPRQSATRLETWYETPTEPKQ